jgi:anti-anti-sigma factor
MGDETNESPTEFLRSDVGGERTLAIVGDVDLAVKTDLDSELADLLAEAHSPALVDLSRVTFMDSTGLNALCGAQRAGRALGTPLVLVAVPEQVRRLLELTGLWDHFEHRDDLLQGES